jgi:hypothetical protein
MAKDVGKVGNITTLEGQKLPVKIREHGVL